MLRYPSILRSGVAALGIAACLTAAAQNVRHAPTRVLRGFNATVMNTNDFYPQIDTSFVDRPTKHEQPMFRDTEPPVPNNLPVGQMNPDLPRGTTGPYYPGLNAGSYSPPDCDLAVGLNDVVEVVNLTIGFYNKSNGANSFTQALSTFFSGIGVTGGLSDPKVFYDRIHDRFFVTVLEIPGGSYVSKLLVAVSDDGNPSGTWYKYRLEGNVVVGGQNYWVDYPGFGYNKDAILINGNLFGQSSGTAGITFMVVPSAPMLTGAAASVTYFRDASFFSAQAAEMISPTIDRIYAVARGSSTTLRLYSFGNLTGVPTMTSTNVSVPSNSTPSIDARSTNSKTLDTLDGRLFTAMFRGTRLLTCHNIANTAAAVQSRWYEVEMSNWPTSGTPSLFQSGNVGDPAFAIDYHMPAISKNSAGDIAMLYTRSSTSITADIAYSARSVADSAGVMGATNLLESSPGNNALTGNRWGDYFGCDVDPVDDVTFWGVGMQVGTGTSNWNWRTAFFKWTVTAPGVQLQSITLDASTVFNGTGTTGHANLTSNAVSNTTVTLLSSNPAAVSVPGSVVVTTGTNTAAFAVSTFTVSTPTSVTITGTYNAVNRQATILVNPPLLLSNAISPGTVTGGDPSTGTVTLDNNAQGGGAVVSLVSSNPAIVQVPANVTVLTGNASANYAITTSNPVSPTNVTVTATYLGTNKLANITVNPGPTIVHPSSFSISPGTQYSGSAGLAGMQASDDSYMLIRPGAVFVNSQFPISMTVTGVGPVMVPSQFQMQIESSATAIGILQKVELFVPVFNTFEMIDTGTAIPTSDAVWSFSTTTDPERFIDPTTGEIIAKVSYKATTAVFTFPWRARIDEVVWKLYP
jgi:hypothetical protein